MRLPVGGTLPGNDRRARAKQFLRALGRQAEEVDGVVDVVVVRFERRGDRAVVFGQPLQRLPRQVEAGPARIWALDVHQRAQRVAVVVEANHHHFSIEGAALQGLEAPFEGARLAVVVHLVERRAEVPAEPRIHLRRRLGQPQEREVVDDEDDLPEESGGLPLSAKNYMTPPGFARLRDEAAVEKLFADLGEIDRAWAELGRQATAQRGADSDRPSSCCATSESTFTTAPSMGNPSFSRTPAGNVFGSSVAAKLASARVD